MKHPQKYPPTVIWFTGLSAAGKTTIANELMKQFSETGNVPVMLDGDEIRKLYPEIKYDEHSRKQHNLNVGAMAARLENEGRIVIVSLIAPYENIRKQIRSICNNYIEVFIATSIDVCIQRDPKGLYKKAMNGSIKDFTGISARYETPVNPELIIDTEVTSIDESASLVMSFYRKRIKELDSIINHKN